MKKGANASSKGNENTFEIYTQRTYGTYTHTDYTDKLKTKQPTDNSNNNNNKKKRIIVNERKSMKMKEVKKLAKDNLLVNRFFNI